MTHWVFHDLVQWSSLSQLSDLFLCALSWSGICSAEYKVMFSSSPKQMLSAAVSESGSPLWIWTSHFQILKYKRNRLNHHSTLVYFYFYGFSSNYGMCVVWGRKRALDIRHTCYVTVHQVITYQESNYFSSDIQVHWTFKWLVMFIIKDLVMGFFYVIILIHYDYHTAHIYLSEYYIIHVLV